MNEERDRRRPVVGTDAVVTAEVAAIVARVFAEGHEGDHQLCSACIGIGVSIGEAIGDREGYRQGDLDGYERGVQQRQFDLAASDPAYRVDRDLEPLPPFHEVRRRREEYRGIDREPVRPLTPEQIAAKAAYSWRRAERAEQQGRRAG